MKRSFTGRFPLMALLILLAAVEVPAQPAAGTLPSYIEMALSGSADLRRLSLDLRSAAEAAGRDWNLLLPSVSLGLSTSYRQGGLPEEISSSASASLSLQLNAGVPAAMKNREFALARSELALESKRAEVITSTAGAFYSLLLVRGEGEVLAEDLALTESQLRRSRTRFENGLANERELLQASLAVEQARLAQEKHRSALNLEERRFRQLVGLEEDEEIVLDGALEAQRIEPDVERLIAGYLHRRSDVRGAELTLLQEEADRGAAAWSRAPSVSLQAGVSGLESVPDQSLSASLSVSIPLDGWVPGSAESLGIRAAGREKEKAEYSLQALRRAAELEIRGLVSALEQAGRSLDIAALQTGIAARLYSLAEQGYAGGTVARLELEEARGDLLSARLDELNGTYAYLSALLDLKAALGIDSMEEIPGSRP